MKKKLLSGILAAAMVMTMAPAVFAVDGNPDSTDTVVGAETSADTAATVSTYAELVNAINSAKDGDTITVSDTISVEKPLTITKTVTLKGGILEAAENFTASSNSLSECSLISMKTVGKTLTLKDIKLDAKQKTLVVYSNAGKVVVDGATITGGKTGSCVAGVYMTSASQFEMNSGSITGNEVGATDYTKYAADLWIGANANGALTAINGGTVGNVFVNSNAWSANNPGGFTMTGGTVENLYVEYDSSYGAAFTYEGGKIDHLYISTTKGNGDHVEVTPAVGMAYVGGQTSEETTAPVAKIGETGYATLAGAVAAAADCDTITILKNATVTEEINFSDKAITLDLNGMTVAGNFSDVYSVIEAQGEHGSLTLTDTSVDKAGKLVSNKYGISAAYSGKLIINSGTVESEYAALAGNNTAGDMNFEVNGGTLTSKQSEAIYMPGQVSLVVNDGVINGGISTRMGQITVNGGTINGMTGDTDSIADYYHYSGSAWIGDAIYVLAGTYDSNNATYGNSCNITINDGVINGKNQYGVAVYEIGTGKAQTVNVNIKGGKFSGVKGTVATINSGFKHTNCPGGSGKHVEADPSKVTSNVAISGGLFASEFDAAFCTPGLTIINNTDESTKAAYPKTVGTIKVDNENKIGTFTKIADPVVNYGEKITSEEQKIGAKAIGDSVKPETLADTTTVTDSDKQQALTALVNAGKVTLTNNKIPDGTTVTVVKENYLDVTVTDLDINYPNDPSKCKVTMDITPKYKLIAVANTANSEEKILLKSAQDMTVTAATKVSVTLPKDIFANKKVYIDHNNGKNLYVATADETGKITFTTNGFSPFTFTLVNPDVVAEVNGNAYKSLQEAADAAKDGDEITIVKNDKLDLNFTATKSVKVTNKTADKITVKFNNTNKDVAKDATETFSYTKPSSSHGGGGSSSSSYAITVANSQNGKVTSSHTTAASGTTVTLTVTPDKGYELDKLTVVNGSNKAVSVTEKNGKYTFTMPSSKVTVTGTFKQSTSTEPTKPSNPFTDVPKGSYYEDAVNWAVDKGITGGTSATTFAPNGVCTRAQAVTFLWRAAGSPAPTASAAAFTDVPAGSYYAEAVQWAVEKNITKGTSATTFSPNMPCSRGQIVTFLWRSQNSPAASMTNPFTDVAANAFYTNAILWAVEKNVTNGTSATTFSPASDCTRAQIVTLLYRALGK